jgi:hypothetical protein
MTRGQIKDLEPKILRKPVAGFLSRADPPNNDQMKHTLSYGDAIGNQ